MRICLIVHHPLDADSGAAGSVLSFAEHYRRRGHDVVVYSHDDLPGPLSPRAREALFPLFVARRLWSAGTRFDVVDASTADAWIWGKLSKRRSGRPALVTRSHGLEHLAHERRVEEARAGNLKLSWKYPLYYGGIRLREVEMSLRAADAVLLLNEEDRRFVTERLGVLPGRTHIVREGIPSELVGRPSPNGARAPRRIAQIGTYVPRKGVRYGARALTDVLERRADVSVRFLGTACEPERVLADFPAELHDRVEIVPRFARDELPGLVQDCQIKLFPTLSEGFGMAALEAMACGLAPVTTAVAGPTMFVRDGENGLVVPPADSAALAAALERLLDDPELLERLRRAAWETAQGYGWQTAADERLAIYENLLAGRRAA